MKLITILSFLLIYASHGFAQIDQDTLKNCKGDVKNSLKEGKWQCFTENDNIIAEGTYKNDKKNGLWTYYDVKGFVSMAMQFENDLPHGYCRKYENRKMIYECFYKQGVKHGFETIYYWDGTVQQYYFYEEGERHKNNLEYFGDNITAANVEFFCNDKRGEGKLYHKNGKAELIFYYLRNQLEGQWTLLYPDEKPQIKGNFKDDSLYFEWEKYSTDGQKEWEIYIRKNEADKKWIRADLLAGYQQVQNYDSGRLNKVSDWISERDKLSGGKMRSGNGERYWYDNNKCLKAKGLYKDGKLNGLYWLYANCKPKEIAVFNYVNNVLQGEYQIKYSSGKNASVGYFHNGTIDSTYTEFFTDGVVALRGQYDKGQRTGIWESYYKNGKLHIQENYKDGVLQGVAKTFFEDGSSISESFTYQNGQKNGKAVAYHLNNSVAAEGIYENDTQNGLWNFYYDTGELSEKGEYENGTRTGKWQTFYTTGEVLSEGLYVNDVEDSVWNYFNQQGLVIEEETWKEGRLQKAKQVFYKPITFFRKKAKLIGERSIFNNTSLAYNKYYDFNRKNIAVRGGMKDGLPQGSWRFNDENGNITAEGTFDNGLRNGKWRFYKDKKVTSEGKYLQGQKQGEWKYYDAKGKVTRTEIFE